MVFFPRLKEKVLAKSSWEEKEMNKEIQRLKNLRNSKKEKYERNNAFDDNLELKDLEPRRKEWDDQDLV